ncbi:hypothetical protein CVS40_0093 [Lucilia cuprina]|nr:hypothetical protein CVS40_0093 [Lucilia cuprina]
MYRTSLISFSATIRWCVFITRNLLATFMPMASNSSSGRWVPVVAAVCESVGQQHDDDVGGADDVVVAAVDVAAADDVGDDDVVVVALDDVARVAAAADDEPFDLHF